MKDVNDLRKGVNFELDGSLYKVLDYSHHKPGRGNATIKIKTINLRTGTTLDMTFQSGDRVQDVSLDYHNAEYLYRDEHFFHFMDLKTYEQPAISAKLFSEMEGYLKSNMEVKLTFFEGEPLDIELPSDCGPGSDPGRCRRARRYCHRCHQESHHRDRPYGQCAELRGSR